MSDNPVETILNGNYVIFQRKDYKKLHMVSEKIKCIFLGKDKIEVDVIVGKPMGSTFKMVPKVGFHRHFTLQKCNLSDITSTRESFKELGSGLDNRTICDDGSSQLLTSGNIEILREKGTAPKEIIEQLVENSRTFQIKTEYSQEKYIKKKEKKYFEFITIKHPTIRLLGDILYNRDLPKSIGIRIDTLSQLTTSLNFQPHGNYILVENGYNGIVAATLLNSIHNGKIILITPGNHHQKQAVLAMNFTPNKMSQLITVRLTTMLELLEKSASLQNNDTPVSSTLSSLIPEINGPNTIKQLNLNEEETEENTDIKTGSVSDITISNDESRNDTVTAEIRKRKCSYFDLADSNLKKPRWAFEAELAVDVVVKKVDGLMIACKEFPANILNKLLPFMLPSRPFVVYSLYQEPLVNLYLQLKQRQDVVFLKISETWLRPYQVLPERTHPAVTISSSSGFLLSGIKVCND